MAATMGSAATATQTELDFQDKKAVEEMSLEKFRTHPFKRTFNEISNHTHLNHALRPTKHYKGFYSAVSETVMFHPYNPLDNNNGLLTSTVTVRCPRETIHTLPEEIRTAVATIDPAKIEIFFVTQNIPWIKTPAPLPLLVRPHYWVHGLPEHDLTMTSSTLNVTTSSRLGIYSRNPAINCDDIRNALVGPIPAVSHPHADPIDGIVCSGDAPNGGVLKGVDYDTTESLYSLVTTPDGRTAITLHWLLRQEDQMHLSNISEQACNMTEFMQLVNQLGTSKLNAENGPLFDLMKLFNITKPELEIPASVATPPLLFTDLKLALDIPRGASHWMDGPDSKCALDRPASVLRSTEQIAILNTNIMELNMLSSSLNELSNKIEEHFAKATSGDDFSMTNHHLSVTKELLSSIKSQITGMQMLIDSNNFSELPFILGTCEQFKKESQERLKLTTDFMAPAPSASSSHYPP